MAETVRRGTSAAEKVSEAYWQWGEDENFPEKLMLSLGNLRNFLGILSAVNGED